MTESVPMFGGSVPDICDSHLGPPAFEPRAADLVASLARLAAAGAGLSAILETAAGTGVVTRAPGRGRPPGAAIVATDLSAPR